MSSRKITDCVEQLQTAWIESCVEFKKLYPNSPQPFLTCTWRSEEDQEILYMMNRNGKDDDKDGKVDEADEWRSNAKPGQSKHNLYPSKAFDVAFKNSLGKLDWSEKLFKQFADIIKPKGVRWGGNFKSRKDTPHFEI